MHKLLFSKQNEKKNAALYNAVRTVEWISYFDSKLAVKLVILDFSHTRILLIISWSVTHDKEYFYYVDYKWNYFFSYESCLPNAHFILKLASFELAFIRMFF